MGAQHLRVPREVVLQAYGMHENLGLSPYQIGAKLGIDGMAIRRWLNTPYYCPWLDEIAVMRALEGEADTFASLTYWERIEFYRLLAQVRKKMRARDWQDYCHELGEKLGIGGSVLGDALSWRQGPWFTADRGRVQRQRQRPTSRPGRVVIHRRDRFGRRNFI